MPGWLAPYNSTRCDHEHCLYTHCPLTKGDCLLLSRMTGLWWPGTCKIWAVYNWRSRVEHYFWGTVTWSAGHQTTESIYLADLSKSFGFDTLVYCENQTFIMAFKWILFQTVMLVTKHRNGVKRCCSQDKRWSVQQDMSHLAFHALSRKFAGLLLCKDKLVSSLVKQMEIPPTQLLKWT